MTAALVGLICVAASGVILVTLHFLPTGLDPIRYAVSDYGWTSYHVGYRTMVVLQGVGAILIAVGLGQETDVQSLGWLYVYGLVRLLVSGFMTDREPRRSSLAHADRSHPHPSRRDGLCLDRRRSVAPRLDGQARRSRPARMGRHGNGDRDRYRTRRPTDSTCRARSDRADPLRRCHHLADRRVGLDHLVDATPTHSGQGCTVGNGSPMSEGPVSLLRHGRGDDRPFSPFDALSIDAP